MLATLRAREGAPLRHEERFSTVRVIALLVTLLAVALFATACGGPGDADKRLAEACERQIAEVAEEAGATPTAKSTEERLAKEQLVKCAGQAPGTVQAAEGEADKAGADDATAEDPGSGGDKAAPAELDPASRELFASSCGGCHALSDAKATGAVGPNLDETQLDSTGVAQKIAEGGGGMPPAVLSGEDADKVAEYVAGAAAAE